jgi:hypothetical protein
MLMVNTGYVVIIPELLPDTVIIIAIFGFNTRLLGLCIVVVDCRPPLWSSGQSFWLQIQRSRVLFPALPDFLSSIGSGTGFTQPREVN